MNMPWDHEPYSDGAEVGGLGIHEALQRKSETPMRKWALASSGSTLMAAS